MATLAILVSCESSNTIAKTEGVRGGDIIFRQGSSKGSVAVLMVDKNDNLYTHVGIVVERDGELMALHTVPDEADEGGIERVKLEPLGDFFRGNRAVSGAIYRTSLSAAELKIVTQQCLYYYDIEMPFDSDYILTDTTQLYCTELLMVSFAKVGYDITAGNSTHLDGLLFNGRYIFPSDILKNRELTLLNSY